MYKKGGNMLLKFNFRNFKSFKDEASLDLTATKISEFAENNFSVGNIKVLPVAGIFGANASGKSNVMDAFRFMRKYILDSLYEILPMKEQRRTKVMPFFMDDLAKESNSKFELYFVLPKCENERIYCYGFEINGNAIKSEWLNYRSKTSRDGFKSIYQRDNCRVEWRGIDTKVTKDIEASLKKNILVLTLGTVLNEQLFLKIFSLFNETNVINFGDSEEDYYIYKGAGNTRYILDPKIQVDVKNYLRSFDNSIVGISAEEYELNTIDHRKEIHVYVHHEKTNSKEIVKLPMIFESSGTQKMFYLYMFFKHSLASGNTLWIDELNSKSHPLLIRGILQTYLNKEINKRHAQLIFTSHDVWQLKSGLLRRDEIWFTEKREAGVSTLYSLSDFIDECNGKIRKDEDYLKNYIYGKYGAIPNLKGFDGVFG